MSSHNGEIVVIVEQPPSIEVLVESPPVIVVEMAAVGMVGPAGAGSTDVADLEVALSDHISNQRPHPSAESGKDFGSWFNAQIA